MSRGTAVVFYACIGTLVLGIALGGILGSAAAQSGADIRVTDAALSESEITAGDSVEVTATVENAGNESGSESIALLVDGETVAEESVSLDANASTTVSFTRAFDEAGEYAIAVNDESAGTLTVEAAAEADIAVTDASLSESQIVAGESVDVSATVENTGDANGTYTAELIVDGSTVDQQTVDVAAGATETVTFTRAFDAAGEYDVAVGDAAAGTLTVEEAAEADISVTEASLSETEITAGDSVDVTATVENAGDATGSITAELTVDGSAVDEQTVEVAAGATERITFTRAFADAGEYDIAVNDEPAGTLTVAEAAEADISVTEASLSETEITAGDSVEVTATLENDGDAEGSFSAELRVDGEVVDAAVAVVGAGESETVRFSRTFDEVGEYAIAVEDRSAGTLRVAEPASADIDVVDAALDRSTITAGESVGVTATVENTGDAEGSFSAELRVDGTAVDVVALVVGAGETDTATFSRTFDDAGEYAIAVNDESAGTLTVEQEAEADIDVIDAGLSDGEIRVGESVTVTATIENDGGVEGSFSAELRVDGTVVDVNALSVAPGETETTEFSRTFEEAGEYAVAVDDESAGDLEVTEPASADIAVTDATLSETEIPEGDAVEVTADLENTGDAAGNYTAELVVDGETVDEETVEVAAGDTETVSFERTFDDAGEYAIAVSGQSAGTLTVEEAAEADISVTEASLSESEITAGESVDVTATVENDGDAAGSLEVSLVVDGDVADSASVDVDANGEETTTFGFTPDEAGEYAVSVNDESAGTLRVTEPASADLAVTDAGLSGTEITTGDAVEVAATVENDGDAAGSLAVELVVDGDAVDEETVEVAAGATEQVAFERTFDDAGEYAIAVGDESAGTLRVTEPASADIEVEDVDLSDDEITAGESVDVTAEIENEGDAEGTYTAELTVGGRAVGERTVELGPGESETVEFTRTFDDPGEYEIAVGGESGGTVTVERGGSPDLEVADAELSEATVTEGQVFGVTAEIENAGDAEGTFTAELEIDGRAVDGREVTLEPGASETVRFNRWIGDAGEYDIAVSGESAGTLVVLEPGQAKFEVSNADASGDAILVGDTATVSAEVTNVGDREGVFTARFLVDGEVVDDEDLTLEADESRTVEFTRAFDDPGEYAIAVGNESAGTLAVERPADPVVTDVSLATTEINATESVEVTATVENEGDREGSIPLELTLNGTVVEVREVSVGPDEVLTERFAQPLRETGTYGIGVSGIDAGDVSVVEVPDDEEPDDGSEESEGSDESEGDGSDDGDADSGGSGGSSPSGSPGSGGSDESDEVDGSDGSDGSDASDGSDESSEGDGSGGFSSDEPSESDASGTESGDDARRVTRTETDDALVVRVENATGTGVSQSVELAGPAATGAVSVSSVGVEPSAGAEPFEVTVERPAADPDGTPAVPRGEALAYVGFDSDLGANETAAATLEFGVDDAAIPDGLEPDDVAVWRYDGERWTGDGVTHEIEGDTHRVALAEPSPVAVVALEPGAVEVVDATVPADWVRDGFQTTMTVSLENTGDRTGARSLTVTMDGETLTEQVVSVEPGETETVDVSFEPNDGGTVALNGEPVGTVSVGEAGDDRSGSDGVSEGPTVVGNVPGFGPVAAVFALLTAALAARVARS